MHRFYMESIKSPLQPKAFIFRRPTIHMSRSAIFSQVEGSEEDASEYLVDSFCVGSDDTPQKAQEAEYNFSFASEPFLTQIATPNPRAARSKAAALRAKIEEIKNRKKFIYTNSSEEDDSANFCGESVHHSPPPLVEISSYDNCVESTSRTIAVSLLQERSVVMSEVVQDDNNLHSSTVPPSVTSDTDAAVVDCCHEVPRSRSSSGKYSSHIAGLAGEKTEPVNHSSFDRILSTSTSTHNEVKLEEPTWFLFVSARQLATTNPIVSALQTQHRGVTYICSFSVADFVVSAQLGILRKLHSDFNNGSSRCRLQETVRRLVSLYDKPHLIVEADRTSSKEVRSTSVTTWAPLSVSSSIFKPSTPYLLQTVAAISKVGVSILYSESQEHTAHLLQQLAQQEKLHGPPFTKVDKLNLKEESIFQFLLPIPEINPAVAVLMATKHNTVGDILCSSSEATTEQYKITTRKAATIVNAFRFNRSFRGKQCC